MSEQTDPRAWAERAEEDYTMAQSALRRKRALTASATFHSQQCAEKYLKAILVAQNQPFPKTHDLRLLNALCRDVGVLAELDASLLDSLSYFAIHARYPGSEPTVEQAHSAMETCKALRRFARKWLGLYDSTNMRTRTR